MVAIALDVRGCLGYEQVLIRWEPISYSVCRRVRKNIVEKRPRSADGAQRVNGRGQRHFLLGLRRTLLVSNRRRG